MSTDEPATADTPAALDDVQESVPSSPPTPPDLETNESKISRKREREVSLEPATPQATTVEFEPERHDVRERRTPAKKNRTSTKLGATEEQDEDADVEIEATPTVTGSPPHETKIRQISRGVEDLTWKRKDAKMRDSSEEKEEKQKSQIEAIPNAEPESEPATDSQMEPQPSESETVPPVQVLADNPPLVYDEDMDDHAGAADPAEKPPGSEPSAPESEPAVITPLAADGTAPRSSSPPAAAAGERDASDSDPDQDKAARLKRKLGDRTASEQLVADRAKGPTVVGKRSRDDEEDGKDANPRETKRPTPPPDEDEKQGTKGTKSPRKTSKERKPAAASSSASAVAPAAVSTPKPSGFMAYASTSSPFSKVAGPSIFGQSKPSSFSSTSTTTNAPSKATSPFAIASQTPPASSFTAAPAHVSMPTSTSAPIAASNSPLAPASNTVPASGSAPAPLAVPSSPPQKRTGFEAFAGASPFASVAKRPRSPARGPIPALASDAVFGVPSKSPARVSAFSAYVGTGAGAYGFGGVERGPVIGFGSTPNGKAKVKANGKRDAAVLSVTLPDEEDEEEEEEEEEEKEDASASFGDILRASKDQEDSEEGSEEERGLKLKEQEIVTGEEDDDTIYQVRGKLFTLSEENQWKEKGTGTLRLNVRQSDGAGARLVMRKEAVYTVLLNVTLFQGMRVFLAQDTRYVRFSVLEAGGTTTHYNLRVANAKIAAEVAQEINAHIPGA